MNPVAAAASLRDAVTVILPSARGGHGPAIARLPRVQLIERAELDRQAFVLATRAGLGRVLTRSRPR